MPEENITPIDHSDIFLLPATVYKVIKNALFLSYYFFLSTLLEYLSLNVGPQVITEKVDPDCVQ